MGVQFKNIVFTGPESCGKTTWSLWCKNTFGGFFIPEFAREYLQGKSGYEKKDLKTIAKGQLRLINKAKNKEGRIWCDTDLLTIKIWSEIKYKACDDWIVFQWKNNLPDMYVLCSPDIPWEEDPLRESKNERGKLFEIYVKELKKIKVDYFILEGNKCEREKRLKNLFS